MSASQAAAITEVVMLEICFGSLIQKHRTRPIGRDVRGRLSAVFAITSRIRIQAKSC
jgi:hypothetical protein